MCTQSVIFSCAKREEAKEEESSMCLLEQICAISSWDHTSKGGNTPSDCDFAKEAVVACAAHFLGRSTSLVRVSGGPFQLSDEEAESTLSCSRLPRSLPRARRHGGQRLKVARPAKESAA